MFGHNRIMKVVREDDGALIVHSIFLTIQGEGPHAGQAAVFVRLTGCSLACSWCDTEFEAKASRMLPAALMREVAEWAPASYKPLIVITGGEPMRQWLTPFILEARLQGYRVQVETAGIHWNSSLNLQDFDIVCSPKTPKVDKNIEDLASFKYIIDVHEDFNEEDGLPALAVSQRGGPQAGKLFRPYWLKARPDRVFVQPLDPPNGPRAHHIENTKRCAALVMKYGYRLSLQQHKILGIE